MILPNAIHPNPPSEQNLTQQVQDVVVVGAGVVGCAVARQLVERGFSVVVVEKAVEFLDGASKGNSAILHTGFDAPTGSLEQACIADGYRQYLELAPRFGLPIMRTGAMVVAWNAEQESQLATIQQKAVANGIEDTQLFSASRLWDKVPHLSTDALGALAVPGEFIIDPWSTPLVYLTQALCGGARLYRNCEVLGGTFSNGVWKIETSKGELAARLVINCSGLYGDIVEQRLTGNHTFEIKPRKGQFVVYDKAAAKLSRQILLPVPDKRTKGIVVCPTIFGNLLVGPTAEEQSHRSEAAVDADILAGLKNHGIRILPELDTVPVTATYAGLRPATEHSEYQIHFDSSRHYVNVGGIRSTGLSAAPGIARYVADEIEGADRGWPSVNRSGVQLAWPKAPVLAEQEVRDWQYPGNGGIVCHCELVTRREIENALQGELPVTSLAGLKRRTRVTMGRCQGFYCSAELAELTAGRLDPPMAVDEL